MIKRCVIGSPRLPRARKLGIILIIIPFQRVINVLLLFCCFLFIVHFLHRDIRNKNYDQFSPNDDNQRFDHQSKRNRIFVLRIALDMQRGIVSSDYHLSTPLIKKPSRCNFYGTGVCEFDKTHLSMDLENAILMQLNYCFWFWLMRNLVE